MPGNWSTFGQHWASPPSLNKFSEQIFPLLSAWHMQCSTNSQFSSRLPSKKTSTHLSPHVNQETVSRPSSQSSFGWCMPTAVAAACSNSYKHNDNGHVPSACSSVSSPHPTTFFQVLTCPSPCCPVSLLPNSHTPPANIPSWHIASSSGGRSDD